MICSDIMTRWQFQYKDIILPAQELPFTVLWPSYLYDENPYTWKGGLDIEMGSTISAERMLENTEQVINETGPDQVNQKVLVLALVV